MSCAQCSGCGPGRWSPEFTKPFKPESNNGCCGNGGLGANNCKTPSKATPGSPLWNWEQVNGKLITTVSTGQDEFGHPVQIIKKTTCPLVIEEKSRYGCTSLRYRVQR